MIPLTPTLSPRCGERGLLAALLVLAFAACDGNRAGDAEASAVKAFTQQHGKHHLHAFVAGTDCHVLLITIDTALDDDLVESIHYGTGGYDAFGGVEQFASDRRFRAVVYRDARGDLWTYGATTRDEARSLPRCR